MFQPPPTVIVNHINYVKCHRARLDAPFGAKPDNEFVKTWKSNIHAPTHTIWCVSTPSNIPPLIWSKSSSVLLLYGHPFHCKKIIILARSFFFLSFFRLRMLPVSQSVSQCSVVADGARIKIYDVSIDDFISKTNEVVNTLFWGLSSFSSGR